jgi:catechol 2,3-dioxygenase-like lactoylglutathione lyase family enzyme
MDTFYVRTVFFVADAERALTFYTKQLGFKLDWTHQEQGRAWVFQVSLFGLELILNQIEPLTEGRAGHGRVFIGLDDEQTDELNRHIEEHAIETTVIHWGNPTLVVRDLDRNELFFWVPERAQASLKARLPAD